ncbi:CheR family methyltransferase [Oceanobacillus damuensis]|uniref:CheR family methyltransferase n=1 Tax=Oceanobacillus damuensis TaxID=937928 RepID=UPI00082C8788|nr:protein-glutamate O-methyltransferase CheR [Oceanobacillus damuensis]
MKDDYMEFIQLVKKKPGIDLSLYKENQMKRRITTLRNKRGFDSYVSYFKAMNKDDTLLNEFTDRLTINVSEFYRNPKRWDVLKDSILPMLLKNNKRISIWSAACSTGEEPYSLALMAKEHFPNARIQLLATDIDANVLAKAKQGVYSEQALKELPDRLIKKHFTQTGSLYKIDESLKKNITFKKHNLLSDPYPETIDLIICRNVLIYFTDQAKEQIYRNFSNSLKKNGVLFVGSTEQIFNPNKYTLHLAETFFYQKA